MTGGRVLRLAGIAGLIGCGPDPIGPAGPAVLISTVTVAPDGAALKNGSTLQMHASSPEPPHAVWSWTLSDSSLASISALGLVTAKHVGKLFVGACVVG